MEHEDIQTFQDLRQSVIHELQVKFVALRRSAEIN